MIYCTPQDVLRPRLLVPTQEEAIPVVNFLITKKLLVQDLEN